MYSILVVLPTIGFNSAYWCQSDSIYVTFLLLFLICFLEKKYLPAFLWYAIAFSIKLQTVFLLPFILIMYADREEFSLLYLLGLPLMLLITGIPKAIAAGKPFYNFTIYFGQIGEGDLNYNAINLFSFFSIENGEVWVPMGVVLTASLFGVCLILTLKKKHTVSPEQMLRLAALSTWACVALLPRMHERYGYLLNILLLILAVTSPGAMNILFSAFCELAALYTYKGYWERELSESFSPEAYAAGHQILSGIFIVLLGIFVIRYFASLSEEEKPALR